MWRADGHKVQFCAAPAGRWEDGKSVCCQHQQTWQVWLCIEHCGYYERCVLTHTGGVQRNVHAAWVTVTPGWHRIEVLIRRRSRCVLWALTWLLFVQMTYSEADLPESLASFFHSPSPSTLPIRLSFRHKRATILHCLFCCNPADTFSRWFSLRDETSLVRSCSRLHGSMRWSVFVYKHFFFLKAIDAAQHVDG